MTQDAPCEKDNLSDIADQSSPMRGVIRTLQVLRALNVRNGASVVELARETGVSRAALYRVLETLREAGYVTVDLARRHYCLTIRVKELAEGFNDEDWITQAARPAIRRLQQRVRWPVDLATFMDSAIWIRETTRPASALTIDRGVIGTRFPLIPSASGRAYLAYCACADREAILRNIIAAKELGFELAADRQAIENILALTRRRGYGIRDGEEPLESGAIAVPIRVNERILGCVTLTFVRRVTSLEAIVSSCLAAMHATAEEIATTAASLASGVIINPSPHRVSTA